MDLLVTGSSGFVGSRLVPFLRGQGHRVVRLTRSQPRPGEAEIQWDPATGTIDTTALEGLDGVIHLAGDPIAAGRWTREKKDRIRDSRVQGTQLLSESLAGLTQPPKVLICASAIGYYGNRGDELLTEESPPGTGFLAEVGREWEGAADPARRKGIRVAHLRFGIILDPSGGALKIMLPPFRFGLGGPLGSGRQYMSWLTREEAVQIIYFTLTHDSLNGPINAASAQPVTNREFSKALGKVLRRPVLFPVPAFAVRILFGGMADEALLASARVQPKILLNAGYRFLHPDLEGALRHLLER